VKHLPNYEIVLDVGRARQVLLQMGRQAARERKRRLRWQSWLHRRKLRALLLRKDLA